MSGWDKAPEYGGGGHWLTNALAVIVALVVMAWIVWPRDAAADPCTAEQPTRAGAEFGGVVRYVGDGDSICVGPADGPGSTWIEVRLADFDAVELGEPGGRQARTIAMRELMGRRIQCVAVRGRNGRVVSYDRVIARCRVNRRAVGEILRAAGAPQGGN
jgi:endonuclease YncB( thermonuclease family)